MSGHTQPLERAPIVAARQVVDEPTPAGLPEAIAEDVRRRPVVFIVELACLLETSVRTIRRQLRAGTFCIPTLPTIDKRYRWSRERVYRALAETTKDSHRRSLLGPRDLGKRGSAAK